MSPVQAWLLFCAALLGYATLLGVPAEALRPVAWVLSAFSGAGFLFDVVDLVLEGRS